MKNQDDFQVYMDDGIEKLARALLIRALMDALTYCAPCKTKKDRAEIITEARRFFYEDSEGMLLFVCEALQLDKGRVRRHVINLIEAQQSGDHTNIGPFWRDLFARDAAPKFNAVQEALDALLKHK